MRELDQKPYGQLHERCEKALGVITECDVVDEAVPVKKPRLAQRKITMLNLEQRIAAALADEATAEEERTKAMDPALSPDPKAARVAMDDAAFAVNRLRTLLPRLKKHSLHIQYAEAHTRWLETHEAVKAKRDAAAEELKVLYPEARFSVR